MRKLRKKNLNSLILTVGLPRSGKSTWAGKQGFPIVNPDSIRLAIHGKAFDADKEGLVWYVAKTMVKALFLSGHHTVILDATNITAKYRANWKSEHWDTYYKEFPERILTCKKRANKINRFDLSIVIDNMAKELSWVRPEEGLFLWR